MRIVVDSSVWIDFFNGRTTGAVVHLEELIPFRRLIVLDLVLCEVLQGFRSDAHHAQALRLLDLCEFHVAGSRELALAAAANYRRLRAAGITPRKTIDVLIATWCVENGTPLLQSDRDFRPMREHLGLKLLGDG
jgi:predicted nucleic acid-binding protein